MKDSMPAAKAAIQFLHTLNPNAGHFNFRSLVEAPDRDATPVKHLRVPLADVPVLIDQCHAQMRGLFVVINEGGDTDASIERIRALFLDIDRKDFDSDETCRQAMRFAHEGRTSTEDPIPQGWPHAAIGVASGGGGYHLYWPLAESLDVAQFKPLQKALAARFRSDTSVCNPSRIMRLPGSTHWKAGEPVMVGLLACKPERRYTVAELVEGLGLVLPDESQRKEQPASSANPSQDPVLAYLLDNPQWMKPGGRTRPGGPLDVVCPNVASHSRPDSLSSTVYMPDGLNGKSRGFKCSHSGCVDVKLGDWLRHIEYETVQGCLPLAKDDGVVCEWQHWLEANGHHVMYIRERWFAFDGSRWKQDTASVRVLMKRFAESTFRAACADVSRSPSDGNAKEHMKAARALLDQRKQDSALAAASIDLRWDGEQLDSRLDELCCPNGVVNLRTGALLTPSPAYGHTQMAGAAYDPEATPTFFEGFMARIQPDAEVRAYIQRLAGYWLTGEVSEEVMAVWTGSGGNGKSTLIESLYAAMGEYAAPGDPSLLVDGKRTPGAASADVMAAIGKRLLYINETKAGERLNDAQVKRLVSTEMMTARAPFGKEMVTFQPTAKLCMRTNNRPEVLDATDGTWRRLHLLPFEKKLVKKSGERELKYQLRDMLSDILAWSVRGAIEYYRIGLAPPPQVLHATAEYRKTSSPFQEWVTERLVQEGWTPRDELLTDYVRFAGLRTPPTSTAFGRMLEGAGYPCRKAKVRMHNASLRGEPLASDLA